MIIKLFNDYEEIKRKLFNDYEEIKKSQAGGRACSTIVGIFLVSGIAILLFIGFRIMPDGNTEEEIPTIGTPTVVDRDSLVTPTPYPTRNFGVKIPRNANIESEVEVALREKFVENLNPELVTMQWCDAQCGIGEEITCESTIVDMCNQALVEQVINENARQYAQLSVAHKQALALNSAREARRAVVATQRGSGVIVSPTSKWDYYGPPTQSHGAISLPGGGTIREAYDGVYKKSWGTWWSLDPLGYRYPYQENRERYVWNQ